MGVNGQRGLLAAVGAEVRVAGPEGRRQVTDHELRVDRRQEGQPLFTLARWVGPGPFRVIARTTSISLDTGSGDGLGAELDAARGQYLMLSITLYLWPDYGWQHGTVARPCPRGVILHATAYT